MSAIPCPVQTFHRVTDGSARAGWVRGGMGGKLLRILAGLAAFVVLLGVVVQTPAGMQRVLLPIAGKLADADISATGGRLDLRGALQFQDLSLRLHDDSLSLRARRARLVIAPMSLFSDGPVVVREFALEDGRLELDAQVVSGEPVPDEALATAPGAARASEGGGTAGSSAPTALPILIERIRVEPLQVEVREAGSPPARLRLEISGEAAGSGVMQTNFSLQAARGTADAGKLSGTVVARGLDGDPEAVQLEASADIEGLSLPVIAAFLSADPAGLEIAGPLDGTLRAHRTAEVVSVGGEVSMEATLPRRVDAIRIAAQGDVEVDRAGDARLDIRVTQPGAPGHLKVAGTAGGATKLRAELVDMDLTPLLEPFLEADTGAEEGAAATEPGTADARSRDAARTLPAEPAEAAPAAEPLDLKVDLRVASSRYHGVEIAQLDATMAIDGPDLRAKLAGKGFSKGDVQAEVHLDDDGQPRIRWEATAKGIRLAPLMDAFAGETRVDGRLSFETHGLSKAPPREPAIDGLDGELDLSLRDGKLAGFEALDLLAKATGIGMLGNFAFSELDGEVDIVDGVATIHKLEAGGTAGNIHATGTVDLRGEGRLDLRINPRVGPRLASKARKLAPLAQLLETTEGLLALPVDLRVTGSFAEVDYAIRTQTATEAVGSRGGRLLGSVLDGVTGGSASKLVGALLPSDEAPAIAPLPSPLP